jgi:hypothetical protein
MGEFHQVRVAAHVSVSHRARTLQLGWPFVVRIDLYQFFAIWP